MNYVEFSISPDSLSFMTKSMWECRNAGLLKIMTRVFEMLQESGELNQTYTIRINTADGPTKDSPKENASNFIEFDTSSFGRDQKLFPDYIFGNWWHIGLVNFDSFIREIVENNDPKNIKDQRMFWKGNLQGVPQRIKYVELCKTHPDKFAGDSMWWTNHGRTPTKFTPMKDFCGYKYLIDLSGTGCSGRLKMLPFCNRPLFIAERPILAWSDTLILEQNLHVPVRHDMGDIFEKYEWADNNQELLNDMAARLLKFCSEKFTFENACRRAWELVSTAISSRKNYY
jgi:hypothetical protein